MKKTAILCATLFVSTFSACSKAPEKSAPAVAVTPAAAQPVAAQVKPAIPAKDVVLAELMRAVFTNAYDKQKDLTVATMPDVKDRKKTGRYAVYAEDFSVLPSGETMLAVRGLVVEEDGSVMNAHVAGGLLSIYALKKNGNKWQVLQRHENLDELGSSGELGELKWIQLDDGKTLLAVLHGGTWSGYTITNLALFDVSHGNGKPLNMDAIAVHSDNEGAVGPGAETWNVDGNWHFAAAPAGVEYDDLVIDFSGSRSIVEGADEENAAKARRDNKDVKDVPAPTIIKGNARYRFDGKNYKLIEGQNLVPSV